MTVMPLLEGWSFSPTSKTVDKAQTNANFTASKLQTEYSISGLVTDAQGTGLAGITIKIAGEGISTETTTGPNGTWSADGLSGTVTVTPEKEGWSFIPSSRQVSQADSGVNFTGTQDAALLSFELSFIHSFLEAEEQKQLSSGAQARNTRLFAEGALGSGSIAPYVAGQFTVMMDPALPRAERERILEQAGYEVLDTLDVIAAHLVTPKGYALTAQADETLLMEALQVIPGVLSVEHNQYVHAEELNVPNDPMYFFQWHYDLIRLPQAWAVTTGSSNVRVAVLDTGVDTDHPELVAHLDLANAWDFTGEGTFEDERGHGTHVAGTIGAASNNGELVAGIMWDVDILPVKVLRKDGVGDTWMLTNGILYAAGLLNDQPDKPTNPRPARIINMSLAASGHAAAMEETVRLASAAGVILVAAAGNENVPQVSYPAAYDQVIAVGATGSGWGADGWGTPQRASYSNYGDPSIVMAPGGDGGHGVWSTLHKDWEFGPIAPMNGTSMATPHVSGVIGLMLANGIPSSQVRDILERTAMKVGDPYEYGHGLINAYWAVQAVENVRIIQGLRSGNRIAEVAKEAEVPLPAQGWYTMELRTGTWQLIAWVDVNANELIDAGDYYTETGVTDFTPDWTQPWSAELEEIGSDLDVSQADLGSLGASQR